MASPKIQLSPSMMCADFLHLGDELALFAESGIEWLHVDIMDGHYVPNFTLGIDFCRALAAATKIPLDVHLMVEHPEQHVASFCSLPGTRVTFHPETVRQPLRLIDRIRELGGSPGIALDPSQTVQQFQNLLPAIDQLMVMTVNPGYAGQKLVPHCLETISLAREQRDRAGLPADISVDGNVSWENIPRMVAAGADILVLGTSALFEKHRSRRESLGEVRKLTASLDARR